MEIALAGKGFTGNNTIAMSNLCRDESCMILEDKIEVRGVPTKLFLIESVYMPRFQ